MNRIGNALSLSTFGESHGAALGGILDGMPSGVRIDMEEIIQMLARRRTGNDPLTSQRRESDIPEMLSGISPSGLTLGTPIGFIFRNEDARSGDYGELEKCFRPNHADYTYQIKYGIRDPRGGGRASARETVNWVMGGALTMQWLKMKGISIEARVTRIGDVGYDDPFSEMRVNPGNAAFKLDEQTEGMMREEVEKARKERDSVGGRVSCVIRNIPSGLGSPVFGKAQSRLAAAMMSLNAAKGFEYGFGFGAASMRGSDSLDMFEEGLSPFPFRTNRNGGLLGGITTGLPIYFNLSLKPTPTIPRPLPMADAAGNVKEITVGGRHDPCVALRAPVIVEALAALVVGDMIKESCGETHYESVL